VFRVSVAAAAVGMAARAIEEARVRAQRRKQFGVMLSEHQIIRAKLAKMATEWEAARLLTWRAAWLADTQRSVRHTKEVAMAKLFATETAQRIIDECVQIHGGEGVRKGGVPERLYREIRSLRIYEGTSEIQHLVIAREMLGS
jgi:alkylation response protein AidB-like acyl-CoA dehydrogenase